MIFQDKLNNIVRKNNSLLSVGLDPQMEKMPKCFMGKKNIFFEFNKAIIEATHDLVCIYKPNSAFYEAYGAEGVKQLKLTCDFIKKTYPNIPILLDTKRGDIGNTNEAYAKYIFSYLGVDATTLQPYLGYEANIPYLELKDKGFFILCRTSNKGAGEFQDLIIDGKPIFEIVAENVAKKWNGNGNCMIVVGATYPGELKAVRRIVGDMTLLVPGVGAQGGDLEKTLKVGLNSKKEGVIINSSRGILYASNGTDFAKKAREEAQKLRDQINIFR